MPLLCMVGASNELPESADLDALYDRFLLRVTVAPVSEAGIGALLALALPPAAAADAPADPLVQMPLSVEAADAMRDAARAVELPDDVVSLLKALRQHLAEEVEPPLYISGARRGPSGATRAACTPRA